MAPTASNSKFQKFIPLTKVDEAKREVGGIVTAEVPDKDGEICHYESTVPYYKTWSEELAKATDGKNLGNLRIMHGLQAAGVGKSLDFNDERKCIEMTFKVVDEAAWEGVKEGMYTGFSQGGEYIKLWKDGGKLFYTAKPYEVSLVDNPCLGVAHFDFIRADGSHELRKFKQQESEMTDQDLQRLADAAAKKAVDSMKEKVDKDSMEEAEKAKATKAKLSGQVQELVKTRQGLKKSMYDVSALAYLLCDLAYLRMSAEYEAAYEEDDSKIPAALAEELGRLCDVFLQMAEEEAEELKNNAAKAASGGLSKMATQPAAPATTAAENATLDSLVKGQGETNQLLKALVEKLGSAKKVDGVAEAQAMGDGEPKPIDPQKDGTETLVTISQKTLDARITEAAQKAADAAVAAVIKAMKEPADDEDEAGKKKKAAKGVGDRTSLVPAPVPVLGPVPVTKTQDSGGAAPRVDEPVDVRKAMEGGDVQEQLKLMGKATMATEVPPTVIGVLSKRA